MSLPRQSWEQCVSELQSDTSRSDLVRYNYFDKSVYDAAIRFFNSAEWKVISSYFPKFMVVKF